MLDRYEVKVGVLVISRDVTEPKLDALVLRLVVSAMLLVVWESSVVSLRLVTVTLLSGPVSLSLSLSVRRLLEIVEESTVLSGNVEAVALSIGRILPEIHWLAAVMLADRYLGSFVSIFTPYQGNILTHINVKVNGHTVDRPS